MSSRQERPHTGSRTLRDFSRDAIQLVGFIETAPILSSGLVKAPLPDIYHRLPRHRKRVQFHAIRLLSQQRRLLKALFSEHIIQLIAGDHALQLVVVAQQDEQLLATLRAYLL